MEAFLFGETNDETLEIMAEAFLPAARVAGTDLLK
jgi:hypothetical protein